MSALPVTADTCPVCGAVHGQLDEFWACPTHGHQLQFYRAEGDFEEFTCPAWKCPYQRSAPRKPRTPSKGDPMTAVATRPSEAVDLMWHRADHLRQLLPSTLDLESFIGSAQAALYNSATLMEAAEKSPDSLMIALTECAALGHLPGSKEYYLTPRKDHGRPKILGIEGYRGIVARMYNSGRVARVVVREVCAKDYFDFTEGQDDYPTHRFGNTNSGPSAPTGAGFFGEHGSVDRGEMVGVYAYAKLLTGEYTRVSLLSREDVYAARASGGWKADDTYSPWNRLDGGPDHEEFRGRSMWWKTALKRSEPWTPTSAEDKRQAVPGAVRAVTSVQQAPAAVVPVSAPQAPAPAVQGERRQAITSGGRARPERREQPARNGVVADALHAAIGQKFDQLGMDDSEERGVYVATLAGKDPGTPLADLAEHDLRGVLAKLADCNDTADLRALLPAGAP